MCMAFAPTWLRRVNPPASHDHFNHCELEHCQILDSPRHSGSEPQSLQWIDDGRQSWVQDRRRETENQTQRLCSRLSRQQDISPNILPTTVRHYFEQDSSGWCHNARRLSRFRWSVDRTKGRSASTVHPEDLQQSSRTQYTLDQWCTQTGSRSALTHC